MPKPTTTHFAVLGLLAVRPWTTYELIQYLKDSLIRNVWTKTEGRLYETPRELVDFGFARSKRERISADPNAAGRERTVYSITQAGRKALRTWLASPSQPPRFEIEDLLKLAYGDQVGVADFVARIEAMQRAMAESANFDGLRDAAAEPKLPSRHHLSARLSDLSDRISWTVWEWLAELRDEVEGWDDMKTSPERLSEAKAIYEEIHDRATRRIAGAEPDRAKARPTRSPRTHRSPEKR